MPQSAQFRRHARLLLLPPLAAALACGGGRGSSAATASSSAPAPAPGASRFVRVPDANTAAILLTSHNVDLAAARIAAARAQHADVKKLARSMIADHTSLSTRLSRLVAAIQLSPRDDEVSRLLRDQSAVRRDTLRRLSGRPFDAAYVENEVRYHEELLVAIDRVFLPSVRSDSLKEYVTTMRPMEVAHLALAEQVRITLARRR